MKTFRLGKKEILIMSNEEKMEGVINLCRVTAGMKTTIDILNSIRDRRENPRCDELYIDGGCDFGIKTLNEKIKMCDDILKKIRES